MTEKKSKLTVPVNAAAAVAVEVEAVADMEEDVEAEDTAAAVEDMAAAVVAVEDMAAAAEDMAATVVAVEDMAAAVVAVEVDSAEDAVEVVKTGTNETQLKFLVVILDFYRRNVPHVTAF